MPISFENHCQACHPLRVSADADDNSLPHGLKDKEIQSLLKEKAIAKWADSDEQAVQENIKIPGRSQILRGELEAVVEKFERNKAASVSHISGQCSKCHELTGESLEVQPTNVPAVWLTKSHFDHYAHRMVDCQACHDSAFKEVSDLPLERAKYESQEVMIPAKNNCVQCHSPEATVSGGVRHDCVLCHRYHVSDEVGDGLQLHRKYGSTFGIEQFLEGNHADSSE